MGVEDMLSGWTGPSSPTEQEKQDRTERMVREALSEHASLKSCSLSVYAKGSYANNTNVRADSDVDIAVECMEAEYWEEAVPGLRQPQQSYSGPWTPDRLRAEVAAALRAMFQGQVDTSGSTAIKVHSSSSRIDADIVPCFSYRYYLGPQSSRSGTKIFTTSGKGIINYPAQQLQNGRAKNARTGYAYKKAVRIVKRLENLMVASKSFHQLPSYFVECLVYNCPDAIFAKATWTETLGAILLHMWNELQGEEPVDDSARWREANECFYLFHDSQGWSRADGREFARAAWNHIGFK